MRSLIISCLLLVVASNEIQISAKCAACQFAVLTGPNRHTSVDLTSKFCGKIEGCAQQFQLCDIVHRLESVKIPDDHPIAAIARDILASVSIVSSQCRLNNDLMAPAQLNIIHGIQCKLCMLIYNFFNDLYAKTYNNPLLQTIPNAFGETCLLSQGLSSNDQPFPLCYPLGFGSTWTAILNGIRDSFGSFYNIVAPIMGCPKIQLIFTNCTS